MFKANKDLVKSLTLEEKAQLVSGKNYWYTAQIDRLNIPAIMVADGPSGLRKQADQSDALGFNGSVEAINFPASALTACSFDCEAMEELGENLGAAAKAESLSVLLGPGINMKRSPLAGRNFEYFSEDPFLAGKMGSSYVKGIQKKGVGVSVKHFAANNRENERFTSSSNIDERTLREIYLRAFEMIVKETNPATLMCSYNKLNGVLASQDHYLLTDILRNEWGFEGLVMSDWSAVADHSAAVHAGLDLEMPGKGEASVQEIIDDVKNGKLSEEDLDTSVLRVLTLVEKFAPEASPKPYSKEEQHQFARKMAANSMVLLKNTNSTLPLKKDESVLFVGELAEKPRYQGGGSSHVNAYNVVTPLQAVEDTPITFAQGYRLDQQADAVMLADAVSAAKSVDKVVVFAGFPEEMESEGFDKTSIALPDNQNRLISEICKVNAKVIVVLQNGSAVEMPWVNEVQSILETYLAGEAVGEATYDVLSGAVNPSGKLAETFPVREIDTPASLTFNASKSDENYHEGLFMGYRYYDKKQVAPLFAFGHGLSYTHFEYSGIKVEVRSKEVIVSLTVKNTGDVKGQEAVQIYIANKTSEIEKPEKELKGFAKVSLQPQEAKKVTVEIPLDGFAWYNPKENEWQIDNGEYTVLVGASSQDILLSSSIEIKGRPEKKKLFNEDSYVGDILRAKELSSLIHSTSVGKELLSFTSDPQIAKMMENMPLRSVSMAGLSREDMNAFISQINEIDR